MLVIDVNGGMIHLLLYLASPRLSLFVYSLDSI